VQAVLPWYRSESDFNSGDVGPTGGAGELNIFGAVLGGAVAMILGLITFATGITHFVTYLLSQRAIASYVGGDDLARRAQLILVGMGVCLGLLFLIAGLGSIVPVRSLAS
jgi:hypothetical protein